MRRWAGGYFKRTHIYTLNMTLLIKVLQGKAGRGSKVDICPALTCCFSTAGQSYLLTTYLSITSELCYLLPVRQDVLFFSFSQNLIYSQKIISGALVGFLEYNYFLFSFLFYKKYFLLIPIRPWNLHFPLYTSFKITIKCFVFHNWIFRWWYRLLQFKSYLHVLIKILKLKHISLWWISPGVNLQFC